jgi:hypothetical protein
MGFDGSDQQVRIAGTPIVTCIEVLPTLLAIADEVIE